jgi:hypothetical protein
MSDIEATYTTPDGLMLFVAFIGPDVEKVKWPGTVKVTLYRGEEDCIERTFFREDD